MQLSTDTDAHDVLWLRPMPSIVLPDKIEITIFRPDTGCGLHVATTSKNVRRVYVCMYVAVMCVPRVLGVRTYVCMYVCSVCCM